MSNAVNDNLIEEAYALMPELVGTGLEHVMESNIAHNDLDALWQNLLQARNLLREDVEDRNDDSARFEGQSKEDL